VLVDGRVLSWIVFANVTPAFVDCFRVDDVPVHWSVGVPLLAASGHADAGLRMPTETVLAGPLRRYIARPDPSFCRGWA